MAVPVPLGLVGAHRHHSDAPNHRVEHATVVAKPHKLAAPRKLLRPQAPPVGSPGGGTKPSLIFHVSHAGNTSSRAARHHRTRAIAHAAGDPADTISDYKFAPASITVHVGDTITWTNNGPTDHTATANDGSFDTGTLKKGQSASQTFTQAGTIAYICKLHPFMHGTVVVLASATTPSSSGSGSGSGSGSTATATTAAASSNPTTAQASGSSLPNTGLDVGATLGVGALLLGLGSALSRRTRPHQ